MTAPTGREQREAVVVESVARALWEADHDRTAWEDATEDGPDEYRRRARAAVTAYRATQDGGAEALRDALLKHHPIANTMTGPLKGCRCGQVGIGQDVIAHVAAELRAVLAATDGTP